MKIARKDETRNTEVSTSDTNNVTLSGTVESILKLARKDSSKSGARFLLGVVRRKDGEAVAAERFNCVAWNEDADVVLEAGEGARVLVTGRLKRENWTTKDGERRYDTSVVVATVEVIQ